MARCTLRRYKVSSIQLGPLKLKVLKLVDVAASEKCMEDALEILERDKEAYVEVIEEGRPRVVTGEGASPGGRLLFHAPARLLRVRVARNLNPGEPVDASRLETYEVKDPDIYVFEGEVGGVPEDACVVVLETDRGLHALHLPCKRGG